jgi:hypothetical protein
MEGIAKNVCTSKSRRERQTESVCVCVCMCVCVPWDSEKEFTYQKKRILPQAEGLRKRSD